MSKKTVMAERLIRVQQYLQIAEDGNTKKAAYQRAADELAAHKTETGDTNKVIAGILQYSEDRIAKLLRWRNSGYKADSPYLMDAKATQRAAQSHTKSVLRDPVQARAAAATMTVDEQAAAARVFMSTPEVVEKVLSTPGTVSKTIRRAAEDEDVKAAKARIKANQDAALQRKTGQPLSRYFLNIKKALLDWTNDLQFLGRNVHELQSYQKPEIVKALEMARDAAQDAIDTLNGNVKAQNGQDDAIEATAATLAVVRELSA